MPREAKHLWPRRTHQTAKTKTTSFGRTSNAPRSETLTAPQQSKNQNYIFRTNGQCSAKRNIYGPAERTKQQNPKLHLSDERTMPLEAKHLRLRNKAETLIRGGSNLSGLQNFPTEFFPDDCRSQDDFLVEIWIRAISGRLFCRDLDSRKWRRSILIYPSYGLWRISVLTPIEWRLAAPWFSVGRKLAAAPFCVVAAVLLISMRTSIMWAGWLACSLIICSKFKRTLFCIGLMLF